MDKPYVVKAFREEKPDIHIYGEKIRKIGRIQLWRLSESREYLIVKIYHDGTGITSETFTFDKPLPDSVKYFGYDASLNDLFDGLEGWVPIQKEHVVFK